MKNQIFINRDKYYIAQQEIQELERLLNEAKKRQRKLYKETNNQSWWDWLCELAGF